MTRSSMQTRVLVLIAGLVVAGAAVTRADRRESAPSRPSFAMFPTSIAEWQGGQDQQLSPEVAKVLGASDYLARPYRAADRSTIGLFMGYWNSQRQGDTIHSPLNCLPGAGWEPVEHSILRFADTRTLSAGEVAINRYVIQKGLDRQLVLYWYLSHGRIVASEYWGKVYLVADAVRLNRTDGSIVRVIAPIAGTTPDAMKTAEDAAMRFVRVLLPRLDEFIPR